MKRILPTKYFVYTLIGPGGIPFYVGMTKNKYRPTSHIRNNKDTRSPLVKARIRQILEAEGKVEIKIVKNFISQTRAFVCEAKTIKLFGRTPRGPLLNLTDGGAGTCGLIATAAAKANMSKASLGKSKSNQHCKNIKNGLRKSKAFKEYHARPKSDETRAKIRAIHLGRKRPLEMRMKIAAANRRRKLGPKSRAKISASLKKFFLNHPEARQAISDARKRYYAQ